ncbi:hypothetical protein BRD56_07425 [Thermoplasmatales archaeon SW_10_69_26]|nr:MAG: hypothetical protein BRD56_07425 [Thermoplasmatales archaeon SW_10_69_26]
MSDDEDGVSYETIKSHLDQQKRSNKPIEVAATFYEEAQAYLDQLREEYEDVHARDPASKEVQILRDELFRAREALNDLFDLRAKRILSHTLSEDTEIDEADLTAEERLLFDNVQEQVSRTREQALERAKRSSELRVVRVLEDMPSFTGADLRIYDLDAEDIVSLPGETAELLIGEGKAAELG